MKITPIRQPISRTQKVIQNIKYGFLFTGMIVSELGLAIKDTFTCEKPYYVEINGKLIDERKLPNAIGRHDYWEGAKWRKIIFSPEDKEKMLHMTRDERNIYRCKLIDDGKYTLSEPK